MSVIKDGRTGRTLVINDEGQALTLSETQTEARHVAEDGNTFLLASDFAVTATVADDFTNIMYLKNESTTMDIHVGYLRSCNEVAGKWQMHFNPTALGTSALTAQNTQLGNSTPLSSTIQTFSNAGTTFVDGTIFAQWIQGGPGHSIQPFDGSLILPPLTAIGFDFAPFGTTAGDACVTMQVWQVAT